MENKPECQFYIDNHKHCVLADECIGCRTPQPPQLRKGEEIKFEGFGEIDGIYRIERINDGVLNLKYLKEPDYATNEI